MVQLKNSDDPKKSKFAPLKEIKMEKVTLVQALELLRYPYIHSQYNGKDIEICKGKFGVYIKYDGNNMSLNGITEKELSPNIFKTMLKGKTKQNNTIRKINKDIVIKNGQYGVYIQYKEKHNVKLYKKIKIEDLTVEDCMESIRKKFKK